MSSKDFVSASGDQVARPQPEAGVAATPARHTPGPWKVIGPRSDGDRIISTVTYDTVAGIRAPTNAVATVGELQVELANARLIAAAPDLLMALKAIVEHNGYEVPNALIAQAEAAIAKASGQ